MKVIAYIPAVLVIAAIAGCASAPKPQIVRVQGDSYCRISERLSYSVRDTTKTIDGVRRSERKRACLCEKPKPQGC